MKGFVAIVLTLTALAGERIARNGPDEPVDQERRTDEDRHELEEPSQQITAHGVVLQTGGASDGRHGGDNVRVECCNTQSRNGPGSGSPDVASPTRGQTVRIRARPR